MNAATALVAPGEGRFAPTRYRDLSLVPVLLVLGVIGSWSHPPSSPPTTWSASAGGPPNRGLLVLAEALILSAGRMDLSPESTIGVAPVIAVWLVLPDHGARFNGLGLFPSWTAIPLSLAVGALIRAVSGFLILKLRLNCFLLTLGALTPLRGLQVAVSEGRSIVTLPGSFTCLGRTSWLGAPAVIWICVLLVLVGGSALAWPGQRLGLPGLRRHRHRRRQPQRRPRHPLRRSHRRPDAAVGGQRHDPGRRAAAVEPVLKARSSSSR